MKVKHCTAQHEVLASFIRYTLQTWGPWDQLPLSNWSDLTINRADHPSPLQLTRELKLVLTRARVFSEECCKPLPPLIAAFWHADRSQAFTDILKELQWCLSVVSYGRICKHITDRSSPKLREFPWEARSGHYEQELLEIAEQQDWRDVMDELKNWEKDHDCSAEACGNIGQYPGFCLAAQFIEKRSGRSSRDDSNHLPTLFTFDEEVLIHGRPLGSGAYAAVTKCTWLGCGYAQKIFNSGRLTSLRDEAEALAKLNHPHIVKVYACSKNSLLLDLMSTDLQKFIEARMQGGARPQPFSLPAAMDLMLQVADAVSYLHSQGMAHRDLKSSNILVDQVGTSGVDVEDGFVFAKVADFGLAKLKHEITSYSHLTHNVGTRRYMAPEIFGTNKDDEHLEYAYPMKADVYSFGVICFEVLSGEEPYSGVPLNSLYSQLTSSIPLRPRLPSSCPTILASLICSCWEADPRERPAFAYVCKVLRYLNGVQSLRGWNPIDGKWPFGRLPTLMEGWAGSGRAVGSFPLPLDIMGVNVQFGDTSMERVVGFTVTYISGGLLSQKFVRLGNNLYILPGSSFSNDWIMFDYPSEYLVQVEVSHSRYPTSVSFITTKKRYGLYGKVIEVRRVTQLSPTSPRRIVGFSTLGVWIQVYVVQDVVRCIQHFLS